ncbi:MAG: cellulase family glycosylhydrolase [Pseudomonadota bacterium]
MLKTTRDHQPLRWKITLFSAVVPTAAVIALLFGLVWDRSQAESIKTKWTTAGQQVLLNGSPFFVKGVSYSPTPVGGSCNWSPYGDWFTPPWKDVHDRDLPRIRALGANSIRVYCWFAHEPDDWNYAAWKTLDFSGPKVKDHRGFLDKAWNGGNKPLYVLINIPLHRERTFYPGQDPALIADSRNVFEFYKKTAQWAAAKYGNHPAVMGFTVGNECNDVEAAPSHEIFWERINEIARVLKAEAPDKLVVSCWFPHPSNHFVNYPRLLQNKNFDVIGVNLYDGDLSNAEFWNLFKETVLDTGFGRPFLVTEFGTPACRHVSKEQVVEDDETHKTQADWITTKWLDIVDHSVLKDPVNGIASGGYVFSWCDEWWKTNDIHGHGAIQDPGFVIQSFLPGGWLDDEWFGLNTIKPYPSRPPRLPWEPDKHPAPYPPDIHTPRKAFHELQKLWNR